jgi:hypothetical protein
MSSKRKYASGYEKRKLKNKREEENKKLSGSLSKSVNCSSSETVAPKVNSAQGPYFTKSGPVCYCQEKVLMKEKIKKIAQKIRKFKSIRY